MLGVFEKIANQLDNIKMTSNECRGFTAELLPDPERKKDEKGKDIEVRHTSRIPNRREKIVDLFANGAGNLGATRWDALNGLTEYVNHHNNIGKLEKGGRRAAERRRPTTDQPGAATHPNPRQPPDAPARVKCSCGSPTSGLRPPSP